MRPVNLIPPEERRGERAPLRTGPLPFALIGGLATVLIAVTMLVLTGNQVRDREAQVAELENRKELAEARSAEFRQFAAFQDLQQRRIETVGTLARSRFDWERVLREVSLLINDDVWLVRMTGTVSPQTTLKDRATVAQRASVPGPALEMIGCGRNHVAVADLVARMNEVDGITRVTVAKSERPTEQANQDDTSQSDSGEADEECRTRDFVTRFEVVAAFDEVEVDPVTGALTPQEPVLREALRDAAGADSRTDAQRAAEDVEDAANLIPGRNQ